MSRDKRGNGIQEVDGSIPFGSTKSIFRATDRSLIFFPREGDIPSC